MPKEKDFKSIEQYSNTLKTLGRVASQSQDSIAMAKLARRSPPFDQDRPELIITSLVPLLGEQTQSGVIDASQGPDLPAS
jgi:hypothetical protein